MNYNDYYLNTLDEANMLSALTQAGVATTSEEGGLQLSTGVSLDVLGHWYERTGGTDDEPVMEQVGGWHFNIRSTKPIEWPEAVIDANPVTPWRVWG